MNVLIVKSSLKSGGGMSEFIKSHYNEMAKNDKVSIDIVEDSGVNDFIDEMPLVNFHSIVSPKKSPLKHIIGWKKFTKSLNHYDIIHIHTDQLSRFYTFYFLRKYKNKVIVHSHSSYNQGTMSSFIKRKCHEIGKKLVKKYNFHKIGVSEEAGKWLFDDCDFTVIHNGIDLEKFKFDIKVRQELMLKYDINENTVIYGHIGRFAYPKNQLRVLDIFSEIKNRSENVKLIFVGDGADIDELKSKVVEYGLEKYVIFTGYQNNIHEYYNLIDIMIFPSFYEGFPLVLIEAQTSGVQINYSDTISEEINILPSASSFSLKDDDSIITNKILKKSNMLNKLSRIEDYSYMKAKGFSTESVVEKLYQFYRKKV